MKPIVGAMFERTGMEDVADMTDRQIRVQQFVVNGEVKYNPISLSKVKLQQLFWAVDYILPALQQHFGASTSSKVMWISGNNEMVNFIQHNFIAHMRTHSLSLKHYSGVYTIDSSQGHGADVVVFFTVVDSAHRNEAGFLKDDSRCCVARSRARHIAWGVSGELGTGNLIGNDLKNDLEKRRQPYLTKHFIARETEGNVFRCAPVDVSDEQIPSHLRVRRMSMTLTAIGLEVARNMDREERMVSLRNKVSRVPTVLRLLQRRRTTTGVMLSTFRAHGNGISIRKEAVRGVSRVRGGRHT